MLASRVVGRDVQLRQLGEAVAAAAAGRGGVVFVVGEAGIGKSRLVEAAVAEPEAGGVLVLRGRAVEAAIPIAYRPIAETLCSVVRAGVLPEAPELSPYRSVLGRLVRGIRPGGRLALLAWRELTRNEWLLALREALAVGRQLPLPPADAPTPFALADPDRVRRILGAAGYEEIGFEPIDEPIEFGADPDDAYSFMRTLGIVEGLTHGLDDAGRAHALAELQKTVAAHHGPDGVLFGTSAWLITARRS